MSNEEASAHLLAAGMSIDEAEQASLFHRGFRFLSLWPPVRRGEAVCLSWPIRTNPSTRHSIVSPTSPSSRLILKPISNCSVFAARLETTNVAPFDGAVQVARDFSWVLASGQDFRIATMARQVIERHWPEQLAKAHEFHCAFYERGAHDLTGTGIIHAWRAGGAPRLEKYLRNRLVLQSYLSSNAAGLVQTLQPYAKNLHVSRSQEKTHVS
jgi:hypothetical protein